MAKIRTLINSTYQSLWRDLSQSSATKSRMVKRWMMRRVASPVECTRSESPVLNLCFMIFEETMLKFKWWQTLPCTRTKINSLLMWQKLDEEMLLGSLATLVEPKRANFQWYQRVSKSWLPVFGCCLICILDWRIRCVKQRVETRRKTKIKNYSCSYQKNILGNEVPSTLLGLDARRWNQKKIQNQVSDHIVHSQIFGRFRIPGDWNTCHEFDCQRCCCKTFRYTPQRTRYRLPSSDSSRTLPQSIKIE